MDKRKKQRFLLGLRYVTKYLADKALRADSRDLVFGKPLDVLCEISYACNLRCPTCFRWTSVPDESELTTDEWKAIIIGLKKWIGVFFLGFSGGEPFLRKDMVELFEFAARQGLLVSAISNGSLIDKNLAEKIVNSGLDVLGFSLNSLKPEVHNKIRGVDTSFSDVMRALGHLKDRGNMRLMVSTTITSENICDLEALAEFVKAEGLNGINFQPLMDASTFPVYDENGRTAKYPEGKLFQDLGKNTEHIGEVFERLLSLKEKGYPITNSADHLRLIAKYLRNPGDQAVSNALCGIGPKNFFIDPFGNVRICSVMEPIGNIAKEPPQAVWNSVKAKKQRAMIRSCDKACRLLNCNFKDLDLGYRVKRILKF